MGLQASQKSESLSGYEYRIVYTYARILGGYLEELRDIIKSRLATSCGHSKSLARYYTSIVPKTTPTGKQLPLGNALKITKIELTDGTIPVITYGTRAPREWHIDPSRRCKNSAHPNQTRPASQQVVRRKYYGTPKPPSIAPILIILLLVMNGIIFFSNPELAQHFLNHAIRQP